jgi:hypothetical protein
MARSTVSKALIAAAVLLCVGPAFAQFGSIFRDDPPRPPADVGGGRAPPPPNYPRSNDRVLPPPQDTRPDLPPSQPLPAPMNLPPSSRPGVRDIESAPLAPLPGGPVAPRPPAMEQPQQARPSQPGQTLPGLPPGQRQPPGAPQQGDTALRPGDEIVVEPPPQRIANPTAVFSGLDKITGRIINFDVAINETVQFGALQVTPRVCYSRPPTETPNTDAYLEVDEVTLSGEIKRIFDGWMFAASPGLHAVEHPVYDVWLTNCKGAAAAVAEAPPASEAKPPAARPPAGTKQPPVQQRPVQPPQQPRTQQQQPSGFQPAFR